MAAGEQRSAEPIVRALLRRLERLEAVAGDDARADADTRAAMQAAALGVLQAGLVMAVAEGHTVRWAPHVCPADGLGATAAVCGVACCQLSASSLIPALLT